MSHPINQNIHSYKGTSASPYSNEEIKLIQDAEDKLKQNIAQYQNAKNTAGEPQAHANLLTARQEVENNLHNNFSKQRIHLIPDLMQQIESATGYNTVFQENMTSQLVDELIHTSVLELSKKTAAIKDAKTEQDKVIAQKDIESYREQIKNTLAEFGCSNDAIAENMDHIDAHAGYDASLSEYAPSFPSGPLASASVAEPGFTSDRIPEVVAKIDKASEYPPEKSLRQVSEELYHWVGNNPRKRVFYNLFLEYLSTNKIKNIEAFRNSLSNFLSPAGSRDLYFHFGLSKGELETAMNIIGADAPAMDNIDMSYTNLLNYRDTLPSTSLLFQAINNLISYLEKKEGDPNIENDFTEYLNGEFIDNYYYKLPDDQKVFFNKVNLPDWLMVPPTDLQEMQRDLKIWAGNNPEKNSFYENIQDYIASKKITTLKDLQSHMDDFLQTPQGVRNVYFQYGLNFNQLREAIQQIIGSDATLHPMDNADVSYTNLVNFRDTPPPLSASLSAAISTLISFLKDRQMNPTVALQFSSFLNGDFQTPFNQLEKNDRSFFNKTNLPDWNPLPPATDIDTMEKNLQNWAGNNSERLSFYESVHNYIANKKITSLKVFQNAIQDFLTPPNNVRNIYFQYGLSTEQLKNVIGGVIGSSATLPPMDNIDLSYTNVLNYRDTLSDPSPELTAAISSLVTYLQTHQTNPSNFTDFLNGEFFKQQYSKLSIYDRAFFNNTNLPDWNPIVPATDIDNLEKNLKVWAGNNPEKKTFYENMVSFIDNNKISTMQALATQISNFLQPPSNVRDIYFQYGLNSTQLQNALTMVGAGNIPPMDNLDISYTNLMTYRDNPSLSPSPLLDAVSNLINFLSQRAITENQFKTYLNGDFLTIYTKIPENQRSFFNANNLPDWPTDLQMLEWQLKDWSKNNNEEKHFYNDLLSFISAQGIQDISSLQSKMPLFLSQGMKEGYRDIYFKYPGLTTNQIQQALNIIGAKITLPSEDSIDISYTNIINYTNDSLPSGLKAALLDLISELESYQMDPHLQTRFANYLNGDFRTNDYNPLPSDQKTFFTQANLPDWMPNPPTDLNTMKANLKSWAGNDPVEENFYEQVLAFITNNDITTLAQFQKALPQLITAPSDKRNIYFTFELSDTQLQQAFNIIGAKISLPKMDNVDKSLINLMHFNQNALSEPLQDAINALIKNLEQNQMNPNIEMVFSQFLNGVDSEGFITKYYNNLALSDREFFTTENLPDWKGILPSPTLVAEDSSAMDSKTRGVVHVDGYSPDGTVGENQIALPWKQWWMPLACTPKNQDGTPAPPVIVNIGPSYVNSSQEGMTYGQSENLGPPQEPGQPVNFVIGQVPPKTITIGSNFSSPPKNIGSSDLTSEMLFSGSDANASMTASVVYGSPYSTNTFKNMPVKISSSFPLDQNSFQAWNYDDDGHLVPVTPSGNTLTGQVFTFSTNPSETSPAIERLYFSQKVTLSLNGNSLQTSENFTGTVRGAILPLNGQNVPTQDVISLFDLHAWDIITSGSYQVGGVTGDVLGSFNCSYRINNAIKPYENFHPTGQPLVCLPKTQYAFLTSDEKVRDNSFYSTVRGSMKLMELPYTGILRFHNNAKIVGPDDALQTLDEGQKTLLANQLIQDANNLPLPEDDNEDSPPGDTYAYGKKLQRVTDVAHQMWVISKGGTNVPGNIPGFVDAMKKVIAKAEQWMDNACPYFVQDQHNGLVIFGPSKDDINANFSNAVGADHQFHYGYFIRTFTMLMDMDPSYLDPSKAQGTARKKVADALIRDVYNYTNDPNFPQGLMYDPLFGISSASGMHMMPDNRNLESTAEDYNCIQAIALYGQKMANNASKYNLSPAETDYYNKLSIQAATTAQRALDAREFFWKTGDQSIYQDPQSAPLLKEIAKNFPDISNQWDTKMDGSTWFGNEPQYIVGIQAITGNPAFFTNISSVTKDYNAIANATNGLNGIDPQWLGIVLPTIARMNTETNPFDPNSNLMSLWNKLGNIGEDDKLDTGLTKGTVLAQMMMAYALKQSI